MASSGPPRQLPREECKGAFVLYRCVPALVRVSSAVTKHQDSGKLYKEELVAVTFPGSLQVPCCVSCVHGQQLLVVQWVPHKA